MPPPDMGLIRKAMESLEGSLPWAASEAPDELVGSVGIGIE
jgi:hypothetical protein